MTKAITTRFAFLLVFTTTFIFNGYAQSEDIIDAYEDYAEAPREVAYVHLNKSTYIEGEMMGFTAYVFDKYTKEPSKVTRNLYCTISDIKGEILKKQLVKVEDGVASSIFNIDSTLASGKYTFKAYTNWMRNFDEQNHYEQSFKVIDADNKNAIKPISRNDIEIDLQTLGEGGHILYDVTNTIGVIAKDQFGNGIANAKGTITDGVGTIISEFQLNDVGLAKTLFTPGTDQTYSISLSANGKTITKPISNIEQVGVVMTLTPGKDRVNIMLKTNSETLENYNNKVFQIGLHNGGEINVTPMQLNNSGTAIISFTKDVLFPGINIFTIFDDKNSPILERLYFNRDGITLQKISKAKLAQSTDTLNISLNVADINPSKYSNLSVSILPTATNSYTQHNTIISQTYIQPYIKGSLQNGGQYFANSSRETAFNLDLLMLTQGWSSYNWSKVFTSEDNTYIYPFEQGIDIVANINGKQKGTYFVYPLEGKNTQLFNVTENDKAFSIKSVYPNEDDFFRVGYLGGQKSLKNAPKIYPQYYPNDFPKFNKSINTIISNYRQNDLISSDVVLPASWTNVEKLDEVVVESETKYTRAEKLKNKTINSRVSIINDLQKKGGMRVDTYLQKLGWITDFDIFSGKLFIINPRVRGQNSSNPTPAVYLDGALVGYTQDAEFGFLTFLTLADIDYIEYEFYSIGGGLLQGDAGFIKIFTSNDTNYKKDIKNTLGTYKIPLVFSKEKEFYTPKYKYYNTDFFREYGTIGWQPNLNFNNNGVASFKIFDTKTDNISLFVEGIVNDNQFVSQEIKIEREN